MGLMTQTIPETADKWGEPIRVWHYVTCLAQGPSYRTPHIQTKLRQRLFTSSIERKYGISPNLQKMQNETTREQIIL